MTQVWAVAAALASALGYAVASVLQHRSARREPAGTGLRLGLLARLASRPVWLAGLLTSAASLALHVLALSLGQLAVVQPLLVSGLLFALPASVALERRRPSAVEWCWALVLVTGLSLFLVFAHPHGGRALPDRGSLVATVAIGAGVAGAAVLAGHRPAHRHRAALLGLACGISYGLTAALIKDVTTTATLDPIRVLISWPLYVLLIIGVAGITLNQAAYQAGPLAASLPPTTIADPVVAVVAGVLVFDERLAEAPPAVAVEILAFVMMGVASVQLARRTAADPARSPCGAGPPGRRRTAYPAPGDRPSTQPTARRTRKGPPHRR